MLPLGLRGGSPEDTAGGEIGLVLCAVVIAERSRAAPPSLTPRGAGRRGRPATRGLRSARFKMSFVPASF